jgi:Peptidase A4 family
MLGGSNASMAGSRRSGITALLALAALAVAACAAGGSAGAARNLAFTALQSSTSLSVSTNWAGYAVTGDSTTYTSATATWKEPTVTCSAEDAGEASAFWVGLGGYSQTSRALEQLGTSADCSSTTGRPTYYAWYELVPNPSAQVKMKIKPGNTVTVSVNILSGGMVEFQVKNRSTGTTFTKEIAFANPDLTSAEWIAEAPSDCDQFRCREIPLSNFGSVSFSKIAAIGNSVGGTLTQNPGWTTDEITLDPDQGRGFFPGPDSFSRLASSDAGATPSAASTDGRSFTVQWSANVSSSSTTTTTTTATAGATG